MDVQKSTPLVWDDLRFVLAVADAGSLVQAARTLRVDHTTVGRRIAAIEESLGVTLFQRSRAGHALTLDGERLLGPMRQVEEAVFSLERAASSQEQSLAGRVGVAAPETFGIAYLAPRLAELGRAYPELSLSLDASGQVLDLHRREADIAVRFFKSEPPDLVVRRVGLVRYGAYATPQLLAERPVREPADLRHHRLVVPTRGTESVWASEVAPESPLAFESELSLVLLAAAVAHAGVAFLPRYLGDAEPRLQRIPLGAEPADPVWLTVHGDVKRTPRVRLVLDFLAESLGRDFPADEASSQQVWTLGHAGPTI